MYDSDWHVRLKAKLYLLGCNIISDTENSEARRDAASQGYRLDIFINDPSPLVRVEVARQGYGLDVLINDPDYYVRQAVAEQRYGLNQLINDKDNHVILSIIKAYNTYIKYISIDRLINITRLKKKINKRLIIDTIVKIY